MRPCISGGPRLPSHPRPYNPRKSIPRCLPFFQYVSIGHECGYASARSREVFDPFQEALVAGEPYGDHLRRSTADVVGPARAAEEAVMLGGVDVSEAVDLGKSQNPQGSITRNVAAKNLLRIGQERNHPLSERESVFLNLIGKPRADTGSRFLPDLAAFSFLHWLHPHTPLA